jgi:IS1 family transposase
MTNVSKKTVMRLLRELGEVCESYQDRVLRNLKCRRIQLDELWGFNYCKDKNVTPDIAARVPNAGDVWLWVAIDPQSKLVPCWHLGDRGAMTAIAFVHDLKDRLANRVQLTSDGHRVYLEAVETAFGSDVDYAMLVKIYGHDVQPDTRYSPPECIGAQLAIITGNPDPKHISTSMVERQNWSVRTAMRRYTRLSNGFSRKIENHAAAVALNYFAYNFIRIHRSLRVSPAMAAGITEHLWSTDDLISSIKGEVKKKHIPFGWNFSCFAAHLIERDLFCSSAACARSRGNATPWFGFSLPAVFIASWRRCLSIPKPTKQNGGQVTTIVLSETRGL